MKENLNEDESRNLEQREPLGKEKIEESRMDKISEVGESRFQKLAALTLSQIAKLRKKSAI